MGNDAADEAAKACVALHDKPPPTATRELNAQCHRAKLVARTIAATLGVFPPMPRERMVRRPGGERGAIVDGRGGHTWRFEMGLWRCVNCLKCTVKNEVDCRMAHSHCKGIKESMLVRGMVDKGHRVAYTEGDIPIVFCMRCGAFAWRRAYGLAKSCRGKPTPAGEQALARIRRGEQPWQQHRGDERVRRPSVRVAGHWDDARSEVVVHDTCRRSWRREEAVARGARKKEGRLCR